MDPKPTVRELSRSIREEALRLGFAGCGFSRAEPLPGDARRLKTWLDRGLNAEMGYMSNHFEKRTDPTLLVDGAKSVVSLLFNYYTEKKPLHSGAPILSKYAYGRDYHFVMKERMRQLHAFILTLVPEAGGRIFVDSAPVLDRAWARKAGLGWIGKNTNLISRSSGSYVFIGELILELELEYNTLPENDFCGSCNRCVEACPTSAILENRTLDAERCISYQTIEKKGDISPALKGRMENRFFGCDICQEVCPWNRQATPHKEPDFEPKPGLLEMSRSDWESLDREHYLRLFRESPVKRAGFDKVRKSLEFLRDE